jgi:iron complex transport system permease protein
VRTRYFPLSAFRFPLARDVYLTRERFARVLLVLAAVLAAAVIGSALVGSERIDLSRALFGPAEGNVDAVILLRIRLPRALMGVVVGGALAAAGTVLQALLRNPLAEPHLLGVSGGAAFGGVLALIVAGASGALPAFLVPLGAFAGALATMLIVYRLGTVHGRLQPYTFLLAGVVCNAFTGALIMALNALADFFQAHGILFWLMGSLQVQSYWLVTASAAYLVVGVLWLLRHTREFNVLSLGEESAAQLGVHVGRTRRVAFAVSSLLVGAAVSVSGMIGFVGLIVPHVTRLLIGADYRLLLPASVLVGGAFLVLADTVARSAFGATEIPVGVVTALCGGPFFIYLLRREGGRTLD